MKLLDFLVELATNSDLMSHFRKAPRETLNAAGLSEDEQQVVLAGDPVALRRTLSSRTGVWWQSASKGISASTPPQPGPTPEPQEEPPHIPEPQFEPVPMENDPPAIIEPPPDEEPPDLDLDAAENLGPRGQNVEQYQYEEPSSIWSLDGLTIVGVGIRAGLQMTIETQFCIRQASKVLYLVADPISEACIKRLSPTAESLGPMYEVGKPRIEIYETMIAKILDSLEVAGDLCVAFYGHPGVLSYPARESIRRARATGRLARMLPAISTEDSLFADLGIDIGSTGLQSYEATRFLFNKYKFDSTAGLVLWQVGVLGETNWNPPHTNVRSRLEILTDYLVSVYGPTHQIFLYHAPEFPTSRPLVERLTLSALPTAEFIAISTLYIPPRGRPERNDENIKAISRVATQN
jgi:hypothetical protein